MVLEEETETEGKVEGKKGYGIVGGKGKRENKQECEALLVGSFLSI